MQRGGSENEAQAVLLRIFEEHQAELYWLAFLLTGDRDHGAEAVIRTVDFTDGANPTFRGFMVSWARKLVIAEALAAIDSALRQSALRLRTPDLAEPPALPPRSWTTGQSITRREFEQALLALDVFPRCAVLLTFFERLSVEEITLLLNADRELVARAQRRGLIELTRNIALGRGWEPAERRSVWKGLGLCRKKWNESILVNG
jgi:DNA-directed RNA polymerase specialized sigma24 family protein